MHHIFRSIVLAHALVLATMGLPTRAAESRKPVFLYSRYYNAEGETRYLADGNFKPLLQSLRADFEVRTHNQPLNAQTLHGVDVVLIANPSDKAVGGHPAPHHVDARDVAELTQFVRNGGALIVTGNQENHNLEVRDLNKLLREFGLRMTNDYVDAKLLSLPKSTPIIGGLRWAYYTGNLIQLEASHAARPRALVTNDQSVKAPKGNRNAAGALMAVAEPGRGRVLVVSDSGWVADWALDNRGVGGVSLAPQDNLEIFRRLTFWLARAK